jgi:hypothetical protein
MATTARIRGFRRAPDALTDQHGVHEVELLEEVPDGIEEERRRVLGDRYVGVAVTRQVDRVHVVPRRERGDHSLKEVELGPHRVQQHQRRALADLEVSHPDAVHRHMADRDVRCPREHIGHSG